MKHIVLLLFAVPAMALALDLPASIELWLTRAEQFWLMDFDNEAQFKDSLKSHWSKIYGGETLRVLIDWIDAGNLESEYYTTFFIDLRDMKVDAFTRKDELNYDADTTQDSCYSVVYNPPLLETIVDEYKVTNMTQKEVDEWRTRFEQESGAEICLDIKRRISLVLDNPAGFIVSESWQITESELLLRPNQSMQADQPSAGR